MSAVHVCTYMKYNLARVERTSTKLGLWRRLCSSHVSVFMLPGGATENELNLMKGYIKNACVLHALRGALGISWEEEASCTAAVDITPSPLLSIGRQSPTACGESGIRQAIKRSCGRLRLSPNQVQLLMRGILPHDIIRYLGQSSNPIEAREKGELLLWGWRQQLMIIWSQFTVALVAWQQIYTPLWSAQHSHRYRTLGLDNRVLLICNVTGCNNRAAWRGKKCSVCKTRKQLADKFAVSAERQLAYASTLLSDHALVERLDLELEPALRLPVMKWPAFRSWCLRCHQHTWDAQRRGIAWTRYKQRRVVPSVREKQRARKTTAISSSITPMQTSLLSRQPAITEFYSRNAPRTALGKIICERIATACVNRIREQLAPDSAKSRGQEKSESEESSKSK